MFCFAVCLRKKSYCRSDLSHTAAMAVKHLDGHVKAFHASRTSILQSTITDLHMIIDLKALLTCQSTSSFGGTCRATMQSHPASLSVVLIIFRDLCLLAVTNLLLLHSWVFTTFSMVNGYIKFPDAIVLAQSTQDTCVDFCKITVLMKLARD